MSTTKTSNLLSTVTPLPKKQAYPAAARPPPRVYVTPEFLAPDFHFLAVAFLVPAFLGTEVVLAVVRRSYFLASPISDSSFAGLGLSDPVFSDPVFSDKNIADPTFAAPSL